MAPQTRELARLRARVAELESAYPGYVPEIEVQARIEAAVAEAQDGWYDQHYDEMEDTLVTQVRHRTLPPPSAVEAVIDAFPCVAAAPSNG